MQMTGRPGILVASLAPYDRRAIVGRDVRQRDAGIPMRRSLLLGMVPLAIFIWQYVITRMLLGNPHGSMATYYFGRAALALLVALFFLKAPVLCRRVTDGLSLPLALVAAVSPIILWVITDNASASAASCFAAGAASSWLYLSAFRIYSVIPLRHSVTQLFGALALSYSFRIIGGFLAPALLLAIGLAMPIVCVSVAGHGIPRHLDQQPGQRRDREGGVHQDSGWSRQTWPRRLYWLFVAEFTVYGCAAGFLRTPYETNQFDIPVNVIGGVLLFGCTLLFLWWARRKDASIHLNVVCQIVLLLLLTVLLALVLLGDINSVAAAIASLFARFGVYTLLLYVSCAFVSQQQAHPYFTFGFAWGFFTLATGIGVTVAGSAGIPKLSSLVALGIAYILVLIFLVTATRARRVDSLSLHEDAGETVGGAVDTRAMLLEDISLRCVEIGVAHDLTKREIEVVQLICLGRSKSHVAEEFGITENTVRGYAKNAYRKLGIHSRQDLLTLIGIK